MILFFNQWRNGQTPVQGPRSIFISPRCLRQNCVDDRPNRELSSNTFFEFGWQAVAFDHCRMRTRWCVVPEIETPISAYIRKGTTNFDQEKFNVLTQKISLTIISVGYLQYLPSLGPYAQGSYQPYNPRDFYREHAPWWYTLPLHGLQSSLWYSKQGLLELELGVFPLARRLC